MIFASDSIEGRFKKKTFKISMFFQIEAEQVKVSEILSVTLVIVCE
jgi:hypothetical protein